MGNLCSNTELESNQTSNQTVKRYRDMPETFDQEIMADRKNSQDLQSIKSMSTASSPTKVACFQCSFIEETDPNAKYVVAKDIEYNTWPKGITHEEAGTLWKVMFCQKEAENGYKVGMGVWILKSGRTLDIHAHQLAEIYFVLGGSSITEIDGQCVKTKPGDVFMIPPDADHVSTGSEEADLYAIFMYPWHAFDDSVYDLYEDKRLPIEAAPEGTRHKDLIDCDEKWSVSNYHPEYGIRRFMTFEIGVGETRVFTPNEQIIHIFIWKGSGLVTSGVEFWDAEPSSGIQVQPGTLKTFTNKGSEPFAVFLVALNSQELV